MIFQSFFFSKLLAEATLYNIYNKCVPNWQIKFINETREEEIQEKEEQENAENEEQKVTEKETTTTGTTDMDVEE